MHRFNEEYVPDLKDLADLAEFSNEFITPEPDASDYSFKHLHMYNFPDKNTGSTIQCPHTACVDMLRSILVSIPKYDTLARQNIISILSLFNITKEMIRDLIDPNMSMTTFDEVIEKKHDYPYLNYYWNMLFSPIALRIFKERINDPLLIGRILPFAQFTLGVQNENKTRLDKYESYMSRLMLIKLYRPAFRPLYCLRGIFANDVKTALCDSHEFNLCINDILRNKRILTPHVLDAQFGAKTNYHASKNTYEVHFDLYAMHLFTTYFDIPFNQPELKKTNFVFKFLHWK